MIPHPDYRSEVPRAFVVDPSQLDALAPTALSANFVDRVIHDLPVEQHLVLLRRMDPQALDRALDTHARRLTFWINLYNGYAQYLLKRDPSLYQRDRSAFFGRKQIDVAGYTVSMEDIEHGVLRRGATIWSLGYIRLLFFRSDFIRRYAIDTVDFRIHFALNCGAASCPAVAVYQAERADAQLDASARQYLQQESRYDAAAGKVFVPALMRWFSADFGSSDDKRAILRRYGVIPAGAAPELEYRPYDWSIQIENYAKYE